MELFDLSPQHNSNILPYDGIAHYKGKIYPQRKADYLFARLLQELQWEHDQAIIFGKHLYTKRKVAWYGTQQFEYRYSGILKKALLWPQLLLDIKNDIELASGETFNSCLCNLYHDGTEGMAWHSDGEKDLKKHGAIASLTFGAERKFGFKHKLSKETIYVHPEHGSLLIMKGSTQDHWLHRLPTTTKVKSPRINLTFRTINIV